MQRQLDRMSDDKIRAAKHQNKAYKLCDGDNLYLHIVPSGGKYWRFKYRFNQKEKSLSLGTYPLTNLEDARSRRDAAKDLLAEGIDPAAIKKQEKAIDKAERLQNGRLLYVRISFDGKIEIWKGGNTLRLSKEEAQFVATLLTNLTEVSYAIK